MKRIIDKYLGWLKDSNRPKHILCGLLVYCLLYTSDAADE